MSGPVVRRQGVSKRFANAAAVNDVSLDLNDGKFLTLQGPSGSGKTAVLRSIALPILRQISQPAGSERAETASVCSA